MGAGARPIVVVSAVNLVEGGPLSILHDCLHAATSCISDRYEVVALVNRASLVGVPGVRYIEIPRAKRSWLWRLYYEYEGFRRLSRELEPRLWLSLHDVTPIVSAQQQVVYCHNPAPFYTLRLRDAVMDPTFAAFNLFYRWLYKTNIQRNRYVIVQQEWLRRELSRYIDVKRIVVAYPNVRGLDSVAPASCHGPLRVVYPAFPRVFKNFEVLGEAACLLSDRGDLDVEMIITIDGSENRYARYLRRRFGGVRGLRFAGLQTRSGVVDLYRLADALVFPSRLETWGLPLTEFRAFGKPILAADLPYAHETLSGYGKVKFFDPDDAHALADHIGALGRGELRFDSVPRHCPEAPFVTNWEGMFELLLGEDPRGSNGSGM